MQVNNHGEDARQDGHGRDRIGEVVVLVLALVNHRVQDQADDRDNQEHVLRDQHDRLMLDEPPQHAEHGQAQQVDRPLDVDRAEQALLQLFRLGWLCMPMQVLLAQRERDQADDHADTGGAEAILPAERFAEPAAQQRGRERADVDAHVEDREAGIAARVFRRVELADDRRDIRFQVTDTHDDEREREVKDLERRGVAHRDVLHEHGTGGKHFAARQRQFLRECRAGRVEPGGMTLDSHQDVSHRQQDAAEQHRLPHTEVAIGQHAADQGQGVDQAGISAEHVEAHLVGEEVVLGEVQKQQVFHSVE